MEIQGDSIVDSVVEYANVKFGVELSVENVSKQLKELSLGKTLAVVDSIKNEDNDEFLDYIDINTQEALDIPSEESYSDGQDVEEAYGTTGTATASAATVRKQTIQTNQANRQAKIAAAPAGSGSKRSTAGAMNKTATGARQLKDPDDEQRMANTTSSASNTDEINRLKDLVMKVAARR